MSRGATHPQVTQRKKGTFSDEQLTRKHPAFGLLSASRGQGGARRLFGSEIPHRDTITIRVDTAYEIRDGQIVRAHPEGSILELEVSEAQWATFVSSLNMGVGVQCTLRYHRNGPVVECPRILDTPEGSKQSEAIRRKAHECTQAIRDGYDKLRALQRRPSISKTELGKILDGMLQAVEHAGANYQFAADMVTEHMESTKTQVMGEIHAHITGLALRYPELAKISEGVQNAIGTKGADAKALPPVDPKPGED